MLAVLTATATFSSLFAIAILAFLTDVLRDDLAEALLAAFFSEIITLFLAQLYMQREICL